MSAQHHDADIDHDVERELVRLLSEAQASHKPVEVKLAGRRYRLVPVDDLQTSGDPVKNYDPGRALEAVEKIAASGGALKGLDIEAFLDEIMESRDQDTPGHRFP